jgi:hypothetical protein
MMRLTKLNPETGRYEYIAKPMEYVEYRALTLAALQKLGEFEDKASDVAEEIFAEIEKWLANDGDIRLITAEKLAELKKKYTESEDTE